MIDGRLISSGMYMRETWKKKKHTHSGLLLLDESYPLFLPMVAG